MANTGASLDRGNFDEGAHRDTGVMMVDFWPSVWPLSRHRAVLEDIAKESRQGDGSPGQRGREPGLAGALRDPVRFRRSLLVKGGQGRRPGDRRGCLGEASAKLDALA